jgi:phosphocarrier protein FPr
MTNGGDWLECRLLVTNPAGLHARPAARFVQTVAAFDAEVVVVNAVTGAGPAPAGSLTQVQTLGVMQGHEVLVRARGPAAAAVLDAVRALAARDFDDIDAPIPAPRYVTPEGLGEPGVMRGLPAAPGVAVGQARRLRRTPIRGARQAGDPAFERGALERALDAARADLRVARDAVATQAGEAHAAIMDAQLMLLDDDAITGAAFGAIDAGRDAPTALRDSIEATAQRFATLDDYQRARGEDIRQVGRLVLEHLAGVAGPPRLRGPGVLIAPDLSAAETAALDMSIVQAIVVATGSPTSHSAIIARALGVPAIVAAGDMALTIVEETVLLVDGDAGTITLDPSERQVDEALARTAARDADREAARAGAAEPAVTRGGIDIVVSANLASGDSVAEAVASGADGVGLLRTEFLFMNRADLPGEEEQVAAYRHAAAGLQGRRLVIRTLDAGGDKPIAALTPEGEANPFLGVRGVRLSLARPDVLRTQLRALLRAAADHPIAVMFPMIAELPELQAAHGHLDAARRELAAEGTATGPVEVGVTVEVPAAALCAEALAANVDFFSIGTNDLTQYALAAERGNAALAALGDHLHPAVLRLVDMVCRAADARGIPVAVCGEAAGDADAVALLVGLGVRELSVPPPRVAEVKRVVRGLDPVAAAVLARRALELADAGAVRELAVGIRPAGKPPPA